MKKSLVLAIILTFACASLSFAKVVKQFYPNKKIKSVIRYNDNKQLDGPYKFFWPNGRLKEQGKYKDGHLIGEPKRYTPDGVLKK